MRRRLVPPLPDFDAPVAARLLWCCILAIFGPAPGTTTLPEYLAPRFCLLSGSGAFSESYCFRFYEDRATNGMNDPVTMFQFNLNVNMFSHDCWLRADRRAPYVSAQQNKLKAVFSDEGRSRRSRAWLLQHASSFSQQQPFCPPSSSPLARLFVRCALRQTLWRSQLQRVQLPRRTHLPCLFLRLMSQVCVSDVCIHSFTKRLQLQLAP